MHNIYIYIYREREMYIYIEREKLGAQSPRRASSRPSPINNNSY